MQSAQPKCQIFLVIGYLGAGKTTFIRNLIKIDKLASKMAIIQNQFSQQMGIQAPLIVNSEGTPFKDFLQLPNGCICCSAKNDLIAAIQYLTQKSNIKYIVIETNGVADPAQSIKQFWLDQSMDISAKLHSILTIVPTHKVREMKEDMIFKKQIIFSNKALLGFLDKATQQEKQDAIQYVRHLNPMITIYESTDPQVYDKLFEGEFFEIKSVYDLPESSHNHSGIHSLVLKFPEFPSVKELERNIGTLLWEHKDLQILRIKGIVVFKDDTNLYELQGVDDTFEINKSLLLKEQLKQSKILVIGKHLDKQMISQILSG